MLNTEMPRVVSSCFLAIGAEMSFLIKSVVAGLLSPVNMSNLSGLFLEPH